MRTLAVVIAVAVAAASPSLAFAAKKAAPAQTFDSLNADGLKALHDVFIWPAEAPAKKHMHHKKMAKKK